MKQWFMVGGLELIEPLRLQEVTEKSPRRKRNGTLSRNTPSGSGSPRRHPTSQHLERDQ